MPKMLRATATKLVFSPDRAGTPACAMTPAWEKAGVKAIAGTTIGLSQPSLAPNLFFYYFLDLSGFKTK
jgi:hypothetical protein